MKRESGRISYFCRIRDGSSEPAFNGQGGEGSIEVETEEDVEVRGLEGVLQVERVCEKPSSRRRVWIKAIKRMLKGVAPFRDKV